jgi:hypothetical protein
MGVASQGGGIYSFAQSIAQGQMGGVVENNTVTDNRSTGKQARGGGIYAGGYFTLTNNVIRGNVVSYTSTSSSDTTVVAHGGGLYADSTGMGCETATTGVIDNNEIVANRALGMFGKAGGAYLNNTLLQNSLVLSNTSEGDYGAIWWRCGGALTHTRIAANTAVSPTGGIFIDGRPVVNHNSLLDNSGYDLNTTSQSGNLRLNARYNWWGTTNNASIEAAIFDWFDGDIARGFVNYQPYLLEVPTLSPAGGAVTGRSSGLVGVEYRFDVDLYPAAALKPVTYLWESEGQRFENTVNLLSNHASFRWETPGLKTIRVTATNSEGSTVVTHTVELITAGNADPYEFDDTCAQAKPIPADGVPQLHTLHSADDVDWVRFDASAGTTYVLEAISPEDSRASMNLEVYGTCSGTTVPGQDNSFGPDVSLTLSAPNTGPLYLRLRDESGAVSRGEAAAYNLSVRAIAQQANPGAVILVAGKLKESDPVQTNIYKVIENAYKTFLANGYPSDRIWYLAPDTSRTNPPEDILVDAVATKDALRDAIVNWARTKLTPGQPLTLYLMDHGDHDVFYLNLINNRQETIEPRELAAWLDEIEAAVPGIKVNVIVEACRSGSFITSNDRIQTISKPGRVVVASTGAWPLAYASPTGGAMFSDAFLAALARGMSLYSSFAEARWAVGEAFPSQTPLLDDDGDGIPNETEDGQIAATRGFAYAGTFSNIAWPPQIVSSGADRDTGQIQARIETQGNNNVQRVWAKIYPPGYIPPTEGEELVTENVPEVELTLQLRSGVYVGSYSFTEPGDYRVVVYATDSRDLLSRPVDAGNGVDEEPTPVTPTPVTPTPVTPTPVTPTPVTPTPVTPTPVTPTPVTPTPVTPMLGLKLYLPSVQRSIMAGAAADENADTEPLTPIPMEEPTPLATPTPLAFDSQPPVLPINQNRLFLPLVGH